MSEPHVGTEDHDEPGRYEIRLKGHLDTRWAERFEGLSLTHASDGTTILAGPVVDQADGPDVNADPDHNRSTKETNT